MLEVMIRMCIEDALDIESVQKIAEFARKKQVTIIDERNEDKKSYLKRYRNEQIRLDNIK